MLLFVLLINMLGLLLVQELSAQNWDLAVAISDRIDFLSFNGSLVGSINGFRNIQAIAFDEIRNSLIVNVKQQSAQENSSRTISRFTLQKENEITAIVYHSTDAIKSLTIDAISDTLFWINADKNSINYINCNSSYTNDSEKVLITLPNNTRGYDIEVDTCNRFLYWIDLKKYSTVLNRAYLLNGSQPEIVLNSPLKDPTGIVYDFHTNSLYWGDAYPNYYYIYRLPLDSSPRKPNVTFKDLSGHPSHIAIDENYIYWFDRLDTTVFRLTKFPSDDETLKPIQLKVYDQVVPVAITTRTGRVHQLKDCRRQLPVNSAVPTVESKFPLTTKTKESSVHQCLNNGTVVLKNGENHCKCLPGYAGKLCEVSICKDYCIRGVCTLTLVEKGIGGGRTCKCPNATIVGDRCETDLCLGYCLNDGICTLSAQQKRICQCKTSFSGVRCEISRQNEDPEMKICQASCYKNALVDNEFVCRCVLVRGDSSSVAMLDKNLTVVADKFFSKEHVQDPAFLILSSIILVLIVTVIVLVSFTCTPKRRPRINKRIIVNKNLTPLTYRPQATTEQCEITIENCCNMNVCETPCFEPSQLRGCRRNDDKKVLLSNMENTEELY